jgi:hypothetical protein
MAAADAAISAAGSTISTAGSTLTGVVSAVAKSPYFWAGAGVLAAVILIDSNDPGFQELMAFAVAGGAILLIVHLSK